MMDRPQRAMVVFAHPDDEIACAGTIAKWTRDGTEVAYVVCTNGDKGTEDRGMTPERLAQIRAKEQRDAAAAVGVQEVVLLGYPDGGLEDTREFRGRLVQQLRRFRPQVVLTHAPVNTRGHQHRDHRMCGTVALDAVFPYARDPWHFAELTQEGLAPHKVEVVLLWGDGTPDVFMDISDTIDVKTQAMLCHRSQFVDRPGRDPNRVPGQFVRERAKQVGEQAGIEFAEAFRKVTFRG